MKVVIAGINPYHYYLQVGCHFYAREFDKRGDEVFYFSEPFNALHLLKNGWSEANRVRLDVWREGGRAFGTRGTAFTPMALIPSYGFFPLSTKAAIYLSQKTCLPSVRQLLKKRHASRVDVLWIDNIYYANLLDEIPHDVSIYRIADNLPDLPRYGANHLLIERELMRRCDIVYGVTNSLVDRAKAERGDRPTHLLYNGVEVDHFDQSTQAPPAVLDQIARPRAVFVGFFDKTYNPDLFFEIARRAPEISFVIISPHVPGVNIANLPNVHHLGPVPYDDLPRYLKACDAGLVTRSESRNLRVVMPLKSLQYMASGLPYVGNVYNASDWNQAKPPGYFGDTAEELTAALRQAVRLSAQERQVFHHFAAQHSWHSRFDQVMEHLRAAGKIHGL